MNRQNDGRKNMLKLNYPYCGKYFADVPSAQFKNKSELVTLDKISSDDFILGDRISIKNTDAPGNASVLTLHTAKAVGFLLHRPLRSTNVLQGLHKRIFGRVPPY